MQLILLSFLTFLKPFLEKKIVNEQMLGHKENIGPGKYRFIHDIKSV